MNMMPFFLKKEIDDQTEFILIINLDKFDESRIDDQIDDQFYRDRNKSSTSFPRIDDQTE